MMAAIASSPVASPTSVQSRYSRGRSLADVPSANGRGRLSQYDDADYALALLERGSSGRAYLLKERVSRPDQLMAAVREVAQGGSVIDPRVVEGLVAQRTRVAQSPIAELTA
jgi:DNA-binding NarL/FixJ family response regulator